MFCVEVCWGYTPNQLRGEGRCVSPKGFIALMPLFYEWLIPKGNQIIMKQLLNLELSYWEPGFVDTRFLR